MRQLLTPFIYNFLENMFSNMNEKIDNCSWIKSKCDYQYNESICQLIIQKKPRKKNSFRFLSIDNTDVFCICLYRQDRSGFSKEFISSILIYQYSCRAQYSHKSRRIMSPASFKSYFEISYTVTLNETQKFEEITHRKQPVFVFATRATLYG